MTNKLPIALFVAWLIVLVLLFVPPRDPPASPSGVGLCRGFPVAYTHPAPLSARVGQHSGLVAADFNAPPWPDDGYTEAHDEPLSYTERFSPEAIGSDWAWAEAATEGCPIATAAVRDQAVGE